MNQDNNTPERLSPAAGSVLPLCPTCGSKPQISVIRTCSQPDWWHARVQCPLPCLSFRDAGDERKGTAIKEATQAWASYAQGSDSVSDTPRTDAHQLKEHMAYDRLWSDFARQLEREIADLMSLLHDIDSVLDDCMMVPANVLPAWNAIREKLEKSEGVKP